MEKTTTLPQQMWKKASFVLLCLGLIFSAFTGFGNESVKANNPIVIMTAEDLDNIRLDMNGYYMLGADIDLNVAPYNEAEGWVPIGDYWNDSFAGTFDGQGYTITGLKIDRSSGSGRGPTGLFGDAAVLVELLVC